jgi:hypothetical protein
MAKSKKTKSRDWLTHHTIHIAVFALVVGLLVGFYASLFFLNSDWKPAVMYVDEHGDHDHTDDVAHDHGDHAHSLYELASQENAPTLLLMASPDTKSGINLHLMVENFVFTPESVNEGNTLGQGHAHLYVDGKKVARVYSEYYHLDLPAGEYEISATLNTDSHFDYSINGELIEASTTVIIE